MMALTCDEILMGRQSQLGPIDPQFTITTPDGPRSAPAQAILDQFEFAKSELAVTPAALAAWLPILRSYMPGLITECLTAQAAAEEMVAEAMQKYMFKRLNRAQREQRSKDIAVWFNDHTTHRSHGRPLRFADVKQQKVRVRLLEDDQALQDVVLSAWHSVQITLTTTLVSKLIENSAGTAWMLGGVVVSLPGPPTPPTPTGPPTPPRP